ncbi:MAG: EAL domain-containing protein [Chromatiales bacterium]
MTLEKPARRTNHPLKFLLFANMAAALILLALGVREYQNFHTFHRQLAETQVTDGAREIALRLREIHTSVALFVLQETQLLSDLVDDPLSDEQYNRTLRRIKLHFPDTEGFMLADHEGVSLLDDPSATLDDQRLFDLKQFAQGRQQATILRRFSNNSYQYDIMVPWSGKKGNRGIYFVAFRCKATCRLLATHQVYGHTLNLYPLNPDDPMDSPKQKAITAEVPGVGWILANSFTPSLFFNKFAEISLVGISILLGFFALSLILYRKARKEESEREITEQRYRDLLETSEDLIWSIDNKGYITQINDAAWPILGYSQEELVGRPLVEMIPDDELKTQFKAIRELLKGTPWNNHITRLNSGDGREVHLRFNALPVIDENGSCVGATGTASNITEQVRAMEVLSEKESRYRQMFEVNQAIKLILDAKSGRIIEANSAAARFYGHSIINLKKMNYSKLNHQPTSQLRKQLNAISQGNISSYQEHHTSASGTMHDVEIQVSPTGTNGNTLLYLIITDVTEREESLRALRDNEQKLHGIIEASVEGIIMFDTAGIVQLFNPAAEMMFGYLEEDIVGINIGQLFSQKQAHASNTNILDTLGLSPNSIARELVGIRKDGSSLPVRLSISRLELDDQTHYVTLIQDISESHQAHERLTYLAQHDVLTGLLNRAEFERRLAVLISVKKAPKEHHVLCFMDVDQFKLINDTCGHKAGDEMLQQLAIIIKSQLKEFELIGRVGGDEFGILLSNCSMERAETICSNLLQTIRSFLFTWEDRSFDVAVSIGLSGFSPMEESTSSILSTADVACHMAKELGRNRLHIYHSGDAELIRHHGDMHLVADINQALNEGRFHLYVQPIVSVGDNGKRHYEVLVRMFGEAGELIIPDNFIPAAERYILMPAIDRWIINELFSTQGENLRHWSKLHPEKGHFLFAINLSGTSLTDEGFLNYLERLFKDWDIPHHAICFEITETAAVANLDRAQHLIERLKSLGCSFALDDFGTGLSSYTYLKDLPVDYLKIDGSFVRNMAKDPVDYAMVESINQIGHILGLKTIAEWAEDEATLFQLRVLNVDYAQGYGVGEPRPLNEFKL